MHTLLRRCLVLIFRISSVISFAWARRASRKRQLEKRHREEKSNKIKKIKKIVAKSQKNGFRVVGG